MIPFFRHFGLLLASTIIVHSATANPTVSSHGVFKRMVHKKQTAGVITLNDVLPYKNTYAVGAIENGIGEILTIDGETWLDFGEDGIGKAVTSIPDYQKAVILVKAEVKEWQSVPLPSTLNKSQLQTSIIELAKSHGLDTTKPFPFMLEGKFPLLDIHVINGINPLFTGHGGQHFLYHRTSELRRNQTAKVLGFYSADIQGVYTHMGDSWHLHALIENLTLNDFTAVHVDDIIIGNDITLLLPLNP